MNRLLMVVAFCCVVAPTGAKAATPHRPVPDFAAKETPPVFAESAIDSIFAARGERIIDRGFVGGFSSGGTRDNPAVVTPQMLPGHRLYFIGTSDLERFEQTRRKVSQMNNWSVGVARANWLWAKNGYKGEVLPMTIMNHRDRGVYVIMTKPINAPVIIAKRDTVFLQPRLVTIGDSYSGRVWFRPSLGAGLISTDPVGFAAPVASLVGGFRFGQTDVGVYAMEGQTFQPDNRGFSRYGLQLGDELGWAFRLGYQSDWTELRGDGHTDRRREGGEAGVAYGTTVVSVSGYFGLGWYSDRRDRDGQLEPSLGLALNLGPVFRTGK